MMGGGAGDTGDDGEFLGSRESEQEVTQGP